MQAVRYTLPECDEAFDIMLKTVLIEMLLIMLQDSDMEIRRLAMTTLNSAAHNKPDLILPHLGELMPYVLNESVVKKELIREVMLGPFKHTVDDGLEVRKVCVRICGVLLFTLFFRRLFSMILTFFFHYRAPTKHFTHSWKRPLPESITLTFTIA